jgi:hypothetical protein
LLLAGADLRAGQNGHIESRDIDAIAQNSKLRTTAPMFDCAPGVPLIPSQ